jgi:hypothetical protein
MIIVKAILWVIIGCAMLDLVIAGRTAPPPWLTRVGFVLAGGVAVWSGWSLEHATWMAVHSDYPPKTLSLLVLLTESYLILRAGGVLIQSAAGPRRLEVDEYSLDHMPRDGWKV